MENKKLWYFQNFNILESLSKEEMIKLSDESNMRDASRNQAIYMDGDEADRVYFLKTGKVKISSYSDEGKEMIHAIVGPGELFGELAIAGESEHEHFAEATEDAKVCSIRVKDFEKYLENNPRLNLRITKLIGLRMQKIQNRLKAMWFRSAPERIESFIKEMAEEHGEKIGEEMEIPLRLKHQEIANLTATTRQTVTSTLNQMEKNGIITYDRKRILIHEPGKLHH